MKTPGKLSRRVVGLGIGIAATAGLVLGVVAPASAWTLTGYRSSTDCNYAARSIAWQGGIITQGCTYRPYDGRWMFSYEWSRGGR